MNSGTGSFAGRRALVTGAGSGIGLACVRLLAGEGAAVAALDVRGDSVAALGPGITGIECDVASEDSVVEAVAAATTELGGLDCVVAAAGIVRPGRTVELDLREWDAVIAVNLTGAFLTIKHTVGHLAAAGGGTVVTIGSVASLVAAGTAASYDASKGGILQLTRAIAVEHAEDGIRANCVCPGVVTTGLAANSATLHGPLGERKAAPFFRTQPPIERWADPTEIASVVAFLCSDGASFMTGAAVPVDGGYTAI